MVHKSAIPWTASHGVSSPVHCFSNVNTTPTTAYLLSKQNKTTKTATGNPWEQKFGKRITMTKRRREKMTAPRRYVMMPCDDNHGGREKLDTSTLVSTKLTSKSSNNTYDKTMRRIRILNKRQKRIRPEEVHSGPHDDRMARRGHRYGCHRITRKNNTWTGRIVAVATSLLILQVQLTTMNTRTYRGCLLLPFVEGRTTTRYDRHGEGDNVGVDEYVHPDSTPQQQENDIKSNVRRLGRTHHTKPGGGHGGGNAVDEDDSLHDRQNQKLDEDDTYVEMDHEDEEYYYDYNNYYDSDDNDSDKENFQQEISGDGTTDGNNTERQQQLLALQIPQLPKDLFARPHRRSLLTWGQTGPNTYQISLGGGAVISTPDDYGIGNNRPSTRKHSKKGGSKGSDTRKPTRRPTRRPTRAPTRRPTRPPQHVPTSPPYGGGGPDPPFNPTEAPTDRRPVLPPIITQPVHPPTEPPVMQPAQPPSSGGGGTPSESFCLAPIKLDFLQFSSIPPAIVPFPSDPNPQDLGTRYIYNNALKDDTTLDNLPGSTSKGVCTRTQARIVHSNNNVVQQGGGVCDFTYTFTLSEGTTNNNEEPRVLSITVSGYIEDATGGTLSVTGGTTDAIGAIGQIQLVPVNLGPNNSGGAPTFVHEDGDVFVDPFFYLTELTLFLP